MITISISGATVRKITLRYFRHAVKTGVSIAMLPIALTMSTAALAQEETADELEEIVVFAEKIDIYDVLPDRKSDSVYGNEQAMEDVARSITLIESELVDLLCIRTVNDFVSITAGSFTGNYFGVPGALDLRGERADNFFRGFRRVENRGNFPTSVAAADYVGIIKGPPPVIYGGGKVGGILNFVPKSAKSKTARLIDEPSGAISLTYGNYNKRLGSAEFGAPFEIGGKKSGVYVFAQVEDSEHYYHDVYNKNRILQAAFDTQASDNITLEYGFMLQDADLNQSLGWNRVTQELIDSEGQRYLAGRAGLDLDADANGLLEPSEIGAFGLEQFAFANPFPYLALSPEQRQAWALDPATVGFTSIDHRTVQTEPGDFSESQVGTAYFDIILGAEKYADSADRNWTIKNQTFFDDMDHTKYSSYGFTADYDAYVIENKTTANLSVSPRDNVYIEAVGGFALRYTEGLERESRGRGYQVLDRRDISFGATGNDRFEGAHTGTGNVAYNWSQDGDITNYGLFALLDIDIADRFNITLGSRWDNYDVNVTGTDNSGVFSSASDDDTAFSYNLSARFAITDSVNIYATHATSEYLELGQGGIIARGVVEGDTWLQDSELTEFGVKGRLFDQRLYFSATYYDQERTSFNIDSQSFDSYTSDGFEFEARIAATETLSFTAAATVQETILQNSPFFLGIPPAALGLDPALTYGGRFTGVGALVGFGGPLEAPTPETLYSFNGIYTNPAGWGFSLGATHVDSMFSGYAKQVKLPAYNVARGALFYKDGPLDLRLNANNLFDEKYYTPQFLFWDTFVSPSVGRTVELTMTYKF